MSDLAKAQKKLAALQGQLETEQTKRQDIERGLAELQDTMGKLVASGKRTAKDVTAELNELRTGIEVARAVEKTLTASIGEAEQVVKGEQIIDFREQAAAKEKELEKHKAKVAELLQPIFENKELAGLVVGGGKAETNKLREIRAQMGHLNDNARRLELGLPLQPNIYEGLPERQPGWYPRPDLVTNIPE